MQNYRPALKTPQARSKAKAMRGATLDLGDESIAMRLKAAGMTVLQLHRHNSIVQLAIYATTAQAKGGRARGCRSRNACRAEVLGSCQEIKATVLAWGFEGAQPCCSKAHGKLCNGQKCGKDAKCTAECRICCLARTCLTAIARPALSLRPDALRPAVTRHRPCRGPLCRRV